ncbi:MAG: hypothetical protein JNL74_21955 [Fibrobacteres bacterium]|nr:hypothetical protein [Fibrobacterota bacterium]
MTKSVLICIVFLFFMQCGNAVAPDTTNSENSKSSDTNPIVTGNGKPAHIRLKSLTASKLTVNGAGGEEFATITYNVTDSTGRTAIDGALIRFVISCSDSVAKLLYDSDTVKNGQVHCHLYSGKASGAVSITAVYFERIGEIIAFAEAVPIMVCSGAPVASRFAVQLTRCNIPAKSGETLKAIAYCADKYGNPSSGAMVHFSTTTGLVLPGMLSDSAGKAFSDLTVYAPFPDSSKGSISASTFDINGSKLLSTFSFVISGSPEITFHNATDTFNVSPNGEALIRFSVADAKGLPLCAGTKISLSLSGGGTLVGENDIIMPDVTTGHTSYSTIFRDDGSGRRLVRLSISSTGVNGTTVKGIWGRVN